jgi:hypothetical protein
MKTFGKVIGALGKVYLVLAGLFVMANLVSIFMNEGWSKVQEIMSPFNLVNFVVMIITFAPGYGLMVWSDKIKKKFEDGAVE